MKYLGFILFYFILKKRKCTLLLMCHLSSEGGFTFLVKEQAADLDQKFIYIIVITEELLLLLMF